MANYNLGRFILVPQGAYNSTATYNRLDVVLYQSSSYICKSDGVKGKTPTNTTYWQLLAAAGQATMTAAQKQEIIDGILSQGVVIDSNYNTFTDAEKEKLASLTAPANGTLTIQRNGTRIGTFSANQSGNNTINIEVPTDVFRMQNADILFRCPTLQKIDRDEVIIERPEPATTYHCEKIRTLTIGSVTDSAEVLTLQPATVYFVAGGDFSIAVPSGAYINTPNCKSSYAYRLTIEGAFLTLTEYKPM